MKKFSVLTIVSAMHLVLSSVWLIFFFNESSQLNDWGPMFSVGLIGIGVLGILVSWLLGRICRKLVTEQPRRIQNTIEIALLAGFFAYLWISF